MIVSRGLYSSLYSAADRQVEFDDEDEDEEVEQIPAPRQTEEEAGTPAPSLPTLQDADDTSASTPMNAGEDDEEDDTDVLPKSSTHPLAQSFSHSDRRPSLSSSYVDNNPLSSIKDGHAALQADRDGDDEEEDTDSNRPLVFTPSLETPIETQANTPQDFESMSPAPAEVDDLKREVQVELVVKGLDEGQAEMEEEMEEVVVKEKEHSHPGSDDSDPIQSMDVESKGVPALDSEAVSSTPLLDVATVEDSSSMEIDALLQPSS
ncbi:hypothetical protein BGZ99_005463 [Dissophora globulifera]|uniref:Uncharacterized protein n=1 Tax=Dissophora globulifera TaxID=979702 RepID=A0A9P6RJA1_9FUNG|nr:hypothetical protein BGZ99_005463 [Dissophora globulifera]